MRIEPGLWAEVGEIHLGPNGKLLMPDSGTGPGIYRFRLTRGSAATVYIGESEDVSRRFGQYRNAEPSQRTNVRMNKLIRECVAAGGVVKVAVVAEAVLRVGESHEPLDLGRRTSRLLVEEHLLDEARQAGETVVNLS